MHYNILSLTVSTVFPFRSKIPYSLYYDAWHCVNSTELIPNNLPDKNCFEEYIRSLGITANTHVIVYDRIGTLPAWKSKRNTKPSFRTWWLFKVKSNEPVQCGMYDQQRFRQACAYVQTNQSLC